MNGMDRAGLGEGCDRAALAATGANGWDHAGGGEPPVEPVAPLGGGPDAMSAPSVDRLACELRARAHALGALLDSGVPFLVAGAYAFFVYTGIFRDTKDLDLMVRERDVPAARRALEQAGFGTELLDPGWIAKAYLGESFVDLIFSSSNGLGVVDEAWFEHAREGTILGHRCALAPVEEIIFTKAFVDERERYDGADVNHLIYACGEGMDWERLLARFGPHWEVLLAHVTFYRFVYPGARSRVPAWLVDELCARVRAQLHAGDEPAGAMICRGKLISAVQYRHDYEQLGMLGLEDGPPALAKRA